jgi:hypothetical protein
LQNEKVSQSIASTGKLALFSTTGHIVDPETAAYPSAEIIKVSLESSEKEGRDKKIQSKGGVMLMWCSVLLFLGIAAFLDSIFTFGEIFRRINSVLFMLVSLGLLVRTSTKIRLAQRESYQNKIQQLEDRIAELTKKEKAGVTG